MLVVVPSYVEMELGLMTPAMDFLAWVVFDLLRLPRPHAFFVPYAYTVFVDLASKVISLKCSCRASIPGSAVRSPLFLGVGASHVGMLEG